MVGSRLMRSFTLRVPESGAEVSGGAVRQIILALSHGIKKQ